MPILRYRTRSLSHPDSSPATVPLRPQATAGIDRILGRSDDMIHRFKGVNMLSQAGRGACSWATRKWVRTMSSSFERRRPQGHHEGGRSKSARRASCGRHARGCAAFRRPSHRALKDEIPPSRPKVVRTRTAQCPAPQPEGKAQRVIRQARERAEERCCEDWRGEGELSGESFLPPLSKPSLTPLQRLFVLIEYPSQDGSSFEWTEPTVMSHKESLSR